MHVIGLADKETDIGVAVVLFGEDKKCKKVNVCKEFTDNIDTNIAVPYTIYKFTGIPDEIIDIFNKFSKDFNLEEYHDKEFFNNIFDKIE